MGKKDQKSESSSKNGAFLSRLKSLSADERFHVALGIMIVILGMYLLLAFFSFFFTGWEDQSMLADENNGLEYLNANIKNWTGLKGAQIADFFINRTFGISCFFYLFYFFLIGLRLMHISPFKMFRTFILCSFFLVWTSLFFGFFFISGYQSSFLFLGGEHGYYMSLWLESNIGWFGTALFLFGSLLLFSIFAFASTLPTLKNLGRKVVDLKNSKKEMALDDSNLDEVKSDAEESSSSVDGEDENPIEDNADQQEDNAPLSNTDEEVKDEPFTQEWIIDPEKTEKSSTPVKDIDDIPFEISQNENEGENQNEETENDDIKEEIVNKEEPVNQENTLTTKIDAGEQPDGIAFEIEKPETDLFDGEEIELYDPTRDLEYYKKPSLDLLELYSNSTPDIDVDEQNQNKVRIVDVLRSFGVEISSIKATVGPTVTLYEVTPAPGVRIAKIRNLGNDIALTLSAKGIRIIAPIPGKGTIGIEVPNSKPRIVPMADIIGSKKFQESKFELPIALGKTITNEVYMLDLCKMPHVLVAGATGQGKSVGLNAIITSLLYKKHPSELKFVMVDPKMVEFSMYAPIEKHFLAKMPDAEDAIITDVTKVVQTLNSLCIEMDQRYELLKDASVRQIKEYNDKYINRKLNPSKGHRFLPYIVVVIDEFADLIMQVGKEVETPIARIAQKARAVGIHMILATQRPSANIITGVIRANFPARFAFKVSTGLESRVILDTGGAEQLIGRGDMLISQGNDFERVQCALVDTPEVERIARYISEQQSYPSALILPEYVDENAGEKLDVDLSKRDPMFNEAAELIVAHQQGSTSMIQRKFSIGYNRAGRIMDQLEAAGIVGPAEGSKARQVLVTDLSQLDFMLKSL